MLVMLFLIISLTESDLIERIRQEISCDDCDVRILSYHIPFGSRLEEFESFELISKDSKAYGRRTFTAYFRKGGKNFMGTIFAYVDRMVQVLVSRKRLERGEKINLTEDLEIRFLPFTLAPKDFISPDEISGDMVLKVPVAKGEILRRAHILEEFVIRKGDKVRLILRTPKIYIEFPAIALSDGKEGQEIKVRNLSSNKVVYGRATEGRIVEVIEQGR